MQACPVCGYDALPRGPIEGVICPSCGVQFRCSDAGPLSPSTMHVKLRKEWVANGAHWYSSVVPKPHNWNPWNQLIEAKLGNDIPWNNTVEIQWNNTSTEKTSVSSSSDYVVSSQ